MSPRRIELRDGLPYGEPSELDEGVVHAKRAASNRARIGVARRINARAAKLRVNRSTGSSTTSRVCVGCPTECRVKERADHAVLGRGARTDVQVFTRPLVVRQAVRSVLFGSVAGLIGMGTAQAADLPVKACGALSNATDRLIS